MSQEAEKQAAEEKRQKAISRIKLNKSLTSSNKSIRTLYVDSIKLSTECYTLLFSMSNSNRKALGDYLLNSCVDLVYYAGLFILKNKFVNRIKNIKKFHKVFERIRTHIRVCLECKIIPPNSTVDVLESITRITEHLYPILEEIAKRAR